MIAIPFLIYAGGMVAVLQGKRWAALMCWLTGTALVLLLFKLHTTVPLNFDL